MRRRQIARERRVCKTNQVGLPWSGPAGMLTADPIQDMALADVRECRQRVKQRRTHREQMSSGLPLKADIIQYSRHVSKVPTTECAGRFAGNLFPRVRLGTSNLNSFCQLL